MSLNYNQISVIENNTCVSVSDSFCLEYVSSKVITIEFFDLIILSIVPLILVFLFVSIFKKK